MDNIENSAAPSETPRIKVLIVDDDKVISDMYVLKFQQSGFEVETALDGKSAVAQIKQSHPDVVLLDIVMFPVSGLQVLHDINEEIKGGKTKVIVLSNLGQREDIEKGMSLGAVDYVVKANVTPSEVVKKVMDIFNV